MRDSASDLQEKKSEKAARMSRFFRFFLWKILENKKNDISLHLQTDQQGAVG